jgi:hypothetical protein
MNLDRQRRAGKQQLEQQCGDWRGLIRPLKPQLSDRATRTVNITPGPQIGYTPRFAYDLHRGMFDGHRLS